MYVSDSSQTKKTAVLTQRSNKIVPQVYRTIIDDVIASVTPDFDEYGLDEEVLQILQARWESRLLETRVADFARAPGAGGDVDDGDIDPNLDSMAAANANPPPSNHLSVSGPSSTPQPAYGLSFPAPGHGLALPGQLMGMQQQYDQMGMPGMTNMGAAGGAANGSRGYDGTSIKQDPDDLLRLRGGAGEDEKPYVKPEPNAAGLLPGDEVIDSDLDDSDDELKDDGEDEEGDVDIVFCVYDKVQRVKNKWKTTFKDGMIHINGRDYLFAKCTGEFEW